MQQIWFAFVNAHTTVRYWHRSCSHVVGPLACGPCGSATPEISPAAGAIRSNAWNGGASGYTLNAVQAAKIRLAAGCPARAWAVSILFVPAKIQAEPSYAGGFRR